jgi:hypothetical protein
MPNFAHLYTTAKVLRATYRIVTTSILLYYIARRLADKTKQTPHPVLQRRLPFRQHDTYDPY